MQSEIERLLELVREWGKNRNLLQPEWLHGQTFKLVSEFGEIAEGMEEHDNDKIMDAFGDTLVVCVIVGECIGRRITEEDLYPNQALSKNCDFTGSLMALGRFADAVGKGQVEKQREELGEFARSVSDFCSWASFCVDVCLENAYDQIKDRRGVMYKGMFIKESDERYESARAELALG